MLVEGEEPELSSFDLSLLDEPAVPNDLFFVREHFPQPRVSAAGWKLSITGAVAKPFEISFDDISAAPRKVLPVTLECAENPVGGGMVSHAEWAGAPLASPDRKAQPKSGARLRPSLGSRWILAHDSARKSDASRYAGRLRHEWREAARQARASVRAIIPGWYGMDSVKWLREIADLIGTGVRQARNRYVRLTRSLLTGTRPAGAVTAMNVKSAFSRPVDGALLTSRTVHDPRRSRGQARIASARSR